MLLMPLCAGAAVGQFHRLEKLRQRRVDVLNVVQLACDSLAWEAALSSTWLCYLC